MCVFMIINKNRKLFLILRPKFKGDKSLYPQFFSLTFYINLLTFISFIHTQISLHSFSSFILKSPHTHFLHQHSFPSSTIISFSHTHLLSFTQITFIHTYLLDSRFSPNSFVQLIYIHLLHQY